MPTITIKIKDHIFSFCFRLGYVIYLVNDLGVVNKSQLKENKSIIILENIKNKAYLINSYGLIRVGSCQFEEISLSLSENETLFLESNLINNTIIETNANIDEYDDIVNKIASNKFFVMPKQYKLELAHYLNKFISTIIEKILSLGLATPEYIQNNGYVLLSPLVYLLEKVYESVGLSSEYSETTNQICIEQADFLLRYIVEALEDIKNNIEIACKIAFKDSTISPSDCILSKIICENSDPHYRGKRVITFHFNNKGKLGKLIYKPSSVLIDFLLVGDTDNARCYGMHSLIGKNYGIYSVPKSFAELLSNEFQNPDHDIINTYIVFPSRVKIGNHYREFGFIEYIEHIDLANQSLDLTENQAKVLARQAGALAGMIWIMGMNDAHRENILINELMQIYFLYLIDAENSFMIDASIIKTMFFDAGRGGLSFIGKITNKQILIDHFNNGLEFFFHFIQSRSHKKWLNHPLLQLTTIRIVPFPTNDFINKKAAIFRERIKGKNLKEILASLESYKIVCESMNEPRHRATPVNEGIRAIIYSGSNNKSYKISLFYGDVPVYKMSFHERSLLNDQNEYILDENNEIANYFIHTPKQALKIKFGIIQKFPFFSLIVQKWIKLNFLQLTNSRISEILDSDHPKNELDKAVNYINFMLSTIYLNHLYFSKEAIEKCHVISRLMDIFVDVVSTCFNLIEQLSNEENSQSLSTSLQLHINLLHIMNSLFHQENINNFSFMVNAFLLKEYDCFEYNYFKIDEDDNRPEDYEFREEFLSTRLGNLFRIFSSENKELGKLDADAKVFIEHFKELFKQYVSEYYDLLEKDRVEKLTNNLYATYSISKFLYSQHTFFAALSDNYKKQAEQQSILATETDRQYTPKKT